MDVVALQDVENWYFLQHIDSCYLLTHSNSSFCLFTWWGWKNAVLDLQCGWRLLILLAKLQFHCGCFESWSNFRIKDKDHVKLAKYANLLLSRFFNWCVWVHSSDKMISILCFFVSLKFGGCYITGQLGEFTI